MKKIYQNVQIMNTRNSHISIAPRQTHGTPGIILSKDIPLKQSYKYDIEVTCRLNYFTKAFLWLGDIQNKLLKYFKLESGRNQIDISGCIQDQIKMGIFFSKPSVRDNLVLEKFTIDIVKKTPVIRDKNKDITYHARQEIKLSNTCVSDILDNSTRVSDGFTYFEPPKRSQEKIDYYISDQQLSERLKRLKQTSI